jgi:hypothetical protein
MAVRVRPVAAAEVACVDAGVKWNPARRGRAEGAAGEICEVCGDGGVKVRWVEEKEGGRTDTTNLIFPLAALQDAGWLPTPPPAGDAVGLPSEGAERESADGISSVDSGGSAAVPVPTDGDAAVPRPQDHIELQTQVQDGAGAEAAAFSTETPAIDTSVEVVAAPPAAPAAATADSPAIAELAGECESSVEPVPAAEWSIADAEAVLSAEHPTAADCQRAADLFADIIESSPGDAAAKAGLRSALAAKRKAKRAGR